MPRIAWTSRIAGRVRRLRMRNSAVDAVPRPPAPYTRYTTCRSSTITVGWASATAVEHLLAPEVPEAEHQHDDRPSGAEQPQVAGDQRGMAVGAVVRVPAREPAGVPGPGLAPGRVERPGPERAGPLRGEQRVTDQGEVDRGRVELEQRGRPGVVLGVGGHHLLHA